nr:MAG TPA: hypothetical protein [Caudoviricetes sp.]
MASLNPLPLLPLQSSLHILILAGYDNPLCLLLRLCGSDLQAQNAHQIVKQLLACT